MAATVKRCAITVKAPAGFGQTVELTVAPKALELAPVGDFVSSDTFEGGGHQWNLAIFLGGTNDEAKGYVSIYLAHLGPLGGPDIACSLTLKACGVSHTNDAVIERGGQITLRKKTSQPG